MTAVPYLPAEGAGRLARVSHASAVAMIVSRSEWRGCHPSRDRASAGSATSSGGSPGRRALRHLPAADLLDRGNHLTHRIAATGPEVERDAVAACGEMAERAQMGIGEIADMDVVADPGGIP